MKLLFNNTTYLQANPGKESTSTHKAHSTNHLPETLNQHLENKFHGQDKIAAPLFDKSQEIAVHLLKILLVPPSKKQRQNKLRSKSMNNRRQWSIVDKFTSTKISTVRDELDCKPKLETEACAWPEQYFNASGEKSVLKPSGYPMCISPTRCGGGGELMKLCLLLSMKMRDDERFEPPAFACNPIANPTRRNQNCCCFPHMHHTQNRNSPRKNDLFSKLKKPAARRNPKNPCCRRHSSEYQRWCSLQHLIPRLLIRYGISLSQSRHLLSTVHFFGALNPCSSLSGDCTRPCDHYMLMNYANCTQFHVRCHKNPSRNHFINCNREVKTDNGQKNFASVSCLLPVTDRTPACGFAYTCDNTLTMCNLWCFNITWRGTDNTFSRSEDFILSINDKTVAWLDCEIWENVFVKHNFIHDCSNEGNNLKNINFTEIPIPTSTGIHMTNLKLSMMPNDILILINVSRLDLNSIYVHISKCKGNWMLNFDIEFMNSSDSVDFKFSCSKRNSLIL